MHQPCSAIPVEQGVHALAASAQYIPASPGCFSASRQCTPSQTIQYNQSINQSINHQSSIIIIHQSINHQSSIINHQSSIINPSIDQSTNQSSINCVQHFWLETPTVVRALWLLMNE
jgi:hypothetical protein